MFFHSRRTAFILLIIWFVGIMIMYAVSKQAIPHKSALFQEKTEKIQISQLPKTFPAKQQKTAKQNQLLSMSITASPSNPNEIRIQMDYETGLIHPFTDRQVKSFRQKSYTRIIEFGGIWQDGINQPEMINPSPHIKNSKLILTDAGHLRLILQMRTKRAAKYAKTVILPSKNGLLVKMTFPAAAEYPVP